MGELTTVVEDDEIISHFNDVLVPHVFDNQAFDENPSLDTYTFIFSRLLHCVKR
jgi:hypothetical protein